MSIRRAGGFGGADFIALGVAIVAIVTASPKTPKANAGLTIHSTLWITRASAAMSAGGHF